MIYSMFEFTLHGHPLQWLVTLHEKSIHSFGHLVLELCHYFHNFDHQALNKKILQLQKAPDESVAQFWYLFHNLTFQFLKDEIDLEFVNERFQYLLHVSQHPHILKSFKLTLAYLGVRVDEPKVDIVAITSDYLFSSHQTSLALQCEAGEGAHPSIKL